VLVVDDDAATRALICGLLGEAGFGAVAADTGEHGLALVDGAVAAIVDVRLPGISGLEVCARLRARDSALPIMLVSGDRVDPLDRAGGLRRGADDYLVKPFDPDELLARLDALLRRSRYRGQPARGLTPREHQVLALLHEGLPDAEIAERLVISRKTVGAHVARVYEKLGVHSRARAVAVAYREELVTPRD
jgi:DNA-binding NarL/FixJ family response regulator